MQKGQPTQQTKLPFIFIHFNKNSWMKVKYSHRMLVQKLLMISDIRVRRGSSLVCIAMPNDDRHMHWVRCPAAQPCSARALPFFTPCRRSAKQTSSPPTNNTTNTHWLSVEISFKVILQPNTNHLLEEELIFILGNRLFNFNVHIFHSFKPEI